MGRRLGPLGRRNGRRDPGRRVETRLGPIAAAAAVRLLAFALALAPSAAFGQGFAQRIAGGVAAPSKNGRPDQSLLKSDSLTYSRDGETVTAAGNVQIYNGGRILQADKVVYDRRTDRMEAQGRVKLTEQDGTVVYAQSLDLSQDFKNGFIQAIRADTADRTHFSAARAERSGGQTTVLDRASYTACEPCKRHPERAPFWQIKARKITDDAATHTLYFEDAALEFDGTPLVYLPFLSAPDPDVRRKSGFLTPAYSYKSQLGVGVTVPYFFNLAPNYDLTLSPTFYARQGIMAAGQWRHRLLNGSYEIRASGIFEADPRAFDQAPFGSRKRARGSIDSDGQFWLNPFWKFGWNVDLASDKFYVRDYGGPGESLRSSFFGVSTSTAYLTGQGPLSYFDLRGYYFQAQSPSVLQAQEPVVAPVINYDRVFPLDPGETHGLGGVFEIDGNLTHLDQSLATYQAIGTESLDQAYNLYQVCETNKIPTYNQNACLLRGVAGDYSNIAATASWKRRIVDPLGEVWTPFAFAHLSGTFVSLNTSNSATFTSANGTSTIPNSAQPAVLEHQPQSFVGQAVPGAGVEWRYPFVASADWATTILEPIAQVIVRSNENPSAAQINEDSQSLVFDDTNLFEWNRFSGADRFEGGTRANYGAQLAMMFNNGGYANLMVGQSYQLAGRNSYALQDALAVGLGSGLDTQASDYVTRLEVSPVANLTFVAKEDLDPTTFAPHRIDFEGNMKFDRVEAGLQFARYVAQPAIGYYVPREGLSPTVKLRLTKNFFVDSDVVFDLSRHYYNAQFNAHAPLFSIAGLGVGVGYSNDCATLAVNYSSVYQSDLLGPASRNQSLLFSLQLRTLGDTHISSGLSDIKVVDGLQTVR